MRKHAPVKKPLPRKTLLIILTVSIALLLVIIFVAFHSNIDGRNATVFTVDGEPVSMAEFSNIMSGLRAEVFQYFVEKYNTEDSTTFWTTSFNGEIPLEVLKQKTLDKLIRIKAEQILLKKNGIAGDISYTGFLQAFKEENQRRKKALERKEPVYGPEQYEEMVYYDVLQGNRVEKLKNKLIDHELSVKDDEIKRFYDDHRENLFKKADGYTPMEEVREQIKNELVNEKYRKMVDSLLETAKVVINEDIYKRIPQ